MKFKFCPECGCKFDGEFRFCPECGLNLADFGAIEKKEQKKDEFTDIDSSFDKQLEEKAQKDKVYQNRLLYAKSLVLQGEYKKAEDEYNEILFEVVDDVIPYIGLIRATSKNFTIFNEEIAELLDFVFDMFGKYTSKSKDPEFKAYCVAMDGRLAQTKQEKERALLEKQRKIKEEQLQKRREEAILRSKQEDEERLRRIKEKEEKQEREILALQENFKYAVKKAKDVIDFKMVGKKVYFGKYPDKTAIEWEIIEDSIYNLFLIVSNVNKKTSFYQNNAMKGVNGELAAFRALFNEKQKSILSESEYVKDIIAQKSQSIRLLNTDEFSKYSKKIDKSYADFWVKRMPIVDIQPHWKGKEENTGVPVLIFSNGKLEFKDKMNAVCDVRPVVMVKKDKFIDVVLNQS